MMKTTTIASNTLQHHVLSRPQPEHNWGKRIHLLLVFQKVWRNWMTQLTTSNDPKIWQTIDRLGNMWWHAYNPATGCSITRESETEILEWIDQRITDE